MRVGGERPFQLQWQSAVSIPPVQRVAGNIKFVRWDRGTRRRRPSRRGVSPPPSATLILTFSGLGWGGRGPDPRVAIAFLSPKLNLFSAWHLGRERAANRCTKKERSSSSSSGGARWSYSPFSVAISPSAHSRQQSRTQSSEVCPRALIIRQCSAV